MVQLAASTQDAVNIFTAGMTLVTAVAALLHALKLDKKPWAAPFMFIGANVVGLLKLVAKPKDGEGPG